MSRGQSSARHSAGKQERWWDRARACLRRAAQALANRCVQRQRLLDPVNGLHMESGGPARCLNFSPWIFSRHKSKLEASLSVFALHLLFQPHAQNRQNPASLHNSVRHLRLYPASLPSLSRNLPTSICPSGPLYPSASPIVALFLPGQNIAIEFSSEASFPNTAPTAASRVRVGPPRLCPSRSPSYRALVVLTIRLHCSANRSSRATAIRNALSTPIELRISGRRPI